MNFLDPKSDIAFKKLFGNVAHKDIVISFLNSVLGRKKGEKIVKVTFNDTTNLPQANDSKLSIVDVRCSDEKGKNYIIEMQILKQEEYLYRCQYYSAAGVCRQIPAGGNYSLLMPVIFIGVLNFDLFPSKKYLSHYYLMEEESRERSFGLQEYHFIELKKFNKKLEKLETLIDKWVYFMQNANALDAIPPALEKTEVIKEAFEVLDRHNWTTAELESYGRVQDVIYAEKSRLQTALKDGRELGKKEGLKEAGIAVAQRALLQGKMSIKAIADLTGISVDEIKQIKKKKRS